MRKMNQRYIYRQRQRENEKKRYNSIYNKKRENLHNELYRQRQRKIERYLIRFNLKRQQTKREIIEREIFSEAEREIREEGEEREES